MDKQQADALIDELHELNKTLKAITSNQERKYELTDVQDIRKKVCKSVEATLNQAFENDIKEARRYEEGKFLRKGQRCYGSIC